MLEPHPKAVPSKLEISGFLRDREVSNAEYLTINLVSFFFVVNQLGVNHIV